MSGARVAAIGETFAGSNLYAPIGPAGTFLIDYDATVVCIWTSAYRRGRSADLLEDATLLRTANTRESDLN